ncbi:MAG: hypothetical protein V3T56_04470 [Gemmatimonadales bacterium]
MRAQRLFIVGVGLTIIATHDPVTLSAQVALGPVGRTGQTLTPVYEGWYRNPDGALSVSFGYFNRNYDEEMDIQIGPDNFVEPGDQNQGQPTHFAVRRHWGVFTIVVPADFRDRIVWTLKNHGRTFSIPANLAPEFEIDALTGEAGSGNTPPVISFALGGPEGAGPTGIMGPKLQVRVREPLTVTVWAKDDGKSSGSVVSSGRQDVPVTLTWFKHRGPGLVEFSEESAQVPVSGGEMTTTATFSEAGDYVLRVRANDASGVMGGGHAQCCWTNGYVKVTVTP